MRRSRSSPSPVLKTASLSESSDKEDREEDTGGALDAAALWTTTIEAIRGMSNVSQEGEPGQDEETYSQRQALEESGCDEEESYAKGMRNLLLSLERNFKSETTTKDSNKSNTPPTHDQVVSVLKKSLSLSKSQKKKKSKNLRSVQPGRGFASQLPDIDEDMSLHVTPSLEDEFLFPLTDTSISSVSSVEHSSPSPKLKDATEPEDVASWEKKVRVQSQLPNVEVLLLRRTSSLQREGSLWSTHSLTQSMRSNCSTQDGSEYYYDDDDDDDDSSAFTRMQSYLSFQTNASTVSFAFQEEDEEDDILADCHSFSWFGK